MIRAISAVITAIALAAGAAIFFSGAAPEPVPYPLKSNDCKSSSYCNHRLGEAPAPTHFE